MSTNNSVLGDVCPKMNMIKTHVYSAQPLENYDRPTLRVNADLRGPDYPSGSESVGETMIQGGDPFQVVFRDGDEFPESNYGAVESIMESNDPEHLEYSDQDIHLHVWPDFITETSLSMVDELEDPDLDGSVHIEDNDSFNINGI